MLTCFLKTFLVKKEAKQNAVVAALPELQNDIFNKQLLFQAERAQSYLFNFFQTFGDINENVSDQDPWSDYGNHN